MAESAPVTPGMALRLGKFCGNGPDLWLRMQASYDLWKANRELGREIDRISTGRNQVGMKAAAVSISETFSPIVSTRPIVQLNSGTIPGEPSWIATPSLLKLSKQSHQ